MAKAKPYIPHGVIPAALTVFHDDYSIDWKSTARHFRFMADVAGVTAITMNGHAAEVHALEFDEQRRLLELGANPSAIASRWSPGSSPMVRIMRRNSRKWPRRRGPAHCHFPPQVLMFGGYMRPEMALVHYKTIADATDLPLILFQYTMASGLGFPFETILRLIDEVPAIRAMKDWCNDPMMHEKAYARAAIAAPAGQHADHAQFVADGVAGDGGQWIAFRRGFGDLRHAGRVVRCRARERSRPRPAPQ